MAPHREGRNAEPFELRRAFPHSAIPQFVIPAQRRASERQSILADDQLIEDIRCGRITEDTAGAPLVRMLVRWRSQAMAGT